MPYGDLLDSFGAVSQRVDDVNHSSKVSIQHVHDESQAHEHFAKALLKHLKGIEGVRESATVADLFAAWSVTQETSARVRVDLARRLNDEFCEPATKLRKDTKHFNVKKIAEGEKLVKELRKAQSKAEDAKTKARQKELDAESATALHDKAKGDSTLTPKQISSIANKEKNALKDSEKAANDHRAAVQKLEATRSNYESGMSMILKELEDRELSRIADIKRSMSLYVEAQREALAALQKNIDAFDATVQNVHNVADVQAFVASVTGAVERGEDVGPRRKSIFRRNTTAAPASPMAGAGAAGATALASPSHESIASAADTSGAGNSNVPSEAGDAASTTNNNKGGGDEQHSQSEEQQQPAGVERDISTEFQAEVAAGGAADNGGDPFAAAEPAGDTAPVELVTPADDTQPKQEQQAAGNDWANVFGNDAGASPSNGNGNNSEAAAAAAAAFGTGAAVAATTAAATATTPSDGTQGTASEADLLSGFASTPTPEPAAAEVSSPAAPADDGNPFGTSDPFGAPAHPAPAAVSPAVIGKAKALYDYASSGPGELSFKEDQILLIYVKNETGWWEGVIEGTSERGVFPSNYTEEI